MSALINIWPKDPGYNTSSGYNVKRYDSQKDRISKVQLLVDSWKATALDHRFTSDYVTKLSCQPYDGAHQLIFLDSSSNLVVLKSEVKTVKVSAEVDEAPEDTCVSVEISGKNLDTAEDFTFFLSVYRRPTITAHTQYKVT